MIEISGSQKMWKLSVCLSTLGLIVSSGCVAPTGILRSRWAMDDPKYAEKYADGAPKSDVLGKLKQAADARFVEGASGLYGSAGVSARPIGNGTWGTVEVGTESYLASFLTMRGSLMGATDGDDYFTGADAGLRVQLPTRLAPFAGVGVFLGAAEEEVLADNDWIDNDDDGRIDEPGEERERFSGALAAFYPELGTHFWWNPNVRLTGFGRYFVTTHGRRNDDWVVGIGLALFSGSE